MNLFSCAYVAFKNFICQKKTMIKIISAYTIIVFAVTCFFGYHNSVYSQIDHIVSKEASFCYAETDAPLNRAEYPEITEEKTLYPLYAFRIDENKKLVFSGIEDVSLFLNGEEYVGKNDFSYDFENEFSLGLPQNFYSVPFAMDAYDLNGVVFSEFDKREFADIAPDEDLILAGDLALEKGGIIVSDYILDKFGIIYDDALGSAVTLKNNATGEFYCRDLILSGVVNSKMFRSSANRDRAQIIISSGDMTEQFDWPIYRYYCSDYGTTVKLAERINSLYNPNLEMYSSAEIQKTIIDDVLSVIIIVLLISLVIWSVTVLYFYYRRRESYRNILFSLGIKQGNSFLISLFELIYCLVNSGAFGFGASIVFIKVFNLYSQNSGVFISLNFTDAAKLFLFCEVFLLAFSAIASWVSTILPQRRK